MKFSRNPTLPTLLCRLGCVFHVLVSFCRFKRFVLHSSMLSVCTLFSFKSIGKLFFSVHCLNFRFQCWPFSAHDAHFLAVSRQVPSCQSCSSIKCSVKTWRCHGNQLCIPDLHFHGNRFHFHDNRFYISDFVSMATAAAICHSLPPLERAITCLVL